jgi:hypothetical protein
MIRLPDLRRRVAFRAHGAKRALELVQGAMDDVEGALGKRQYRVVAFQARWAVLQCLSIRSLAREGELDFDTHSVSFDFFAGLTHEEIAEGLTLAHAALDIDKGGADEWLDRLQAYVAATQELLGYSAPLPVLRSPTGPFALIALSRTWSRTLQELGIPGLLQADWLPPHAQDD